jgi:ribonucleoside-triphosphate reductase
MKVIKRDNKTMEYFNVEKIRNAIMKAVKDSHSEEELEQRFDENKFNYLIYKIVDEIISNKLEESELADKTIVTVDEAQDVLFKSMNACTITVEEIQDIVERNLIKCGFADTAKAYILYRQKRTDIRNSRDSISKTISDILVLDAKSNDTKRENANIDGDSAMGTMLQIGSNVSKNFYLNNMMSKDITRNHIDGHIHIHDLDFYKLTVTCCQIDFEKLAKGGFNTGHGYLREPQSIGSYTTLAAIAIQSDQNDCHGGQSIPNFDYSMTPGIYKSFRKAIDKNFKKFIEFNDVSLTPLSDEKLNILANHVTDIIFGEYNYDVLLGENTVFDDKDTEINSIMNKIVNISKEDLERECYQAMEGFVHNLNTLHSRAGGQVPFSSVNLGTDTSNAGRMVTKNLLLAMEAGLGHGETCIFPIVIFKVKEGINYNPKDKNYDLFKLSFRVTGKRLFPNYIFLDSPFNLQYYKPGHPETEVAQMGCRTRVIGNVYDPTREISYSRGNLSFTTINLPMLAIEANHDEKKFYELLDKYLELVKKQLLERFEIQSHLKVKNLPFLMGQGVWLDSEKLGPEDEVGEVLKHGSLSIGFIGLAEALIALYGHHHGEGQEYWDKGYTIIKHMREYTDKVASETHLNFSVLASPSEGLCGTALRKCRAKYGVIEGVTDKDYLTNSNH